MKLLGAILSVALLTTVTATAQPPSPVQSANRDTVGELVRKLVAHRGVSMKREGSIRKKVVGLDSADSSFLFAAAGNVEGAGGTHFQSDVTLFNHRATSQRIAMAWLAQGVDNTQEPVQYMTLDANAPAILPDFVVATLGKSGLGAVLITGVDDAGDPDDAALIDGTSRIWTQQPGANGTVSQNFGSVSVVDSLGPDAAFALGNRHDDGYRTNVGVVNLDSVAHDWTVNVDGVTSDTSFPVSVPPMSMRQVALPAGNYGDLVLSFTTEDFEFWWSAYGASVDNISGDSWSSHAAQP